MTVLYLVQPGRESFSNGVSLLCQTMSGCSQVGKGIYMEWAKVNGMNDRGAVNYSTDLVLQT